MGEFNFTKTYESCSREASQKTAPLMQEFCKMTNVNNVNIVNIVNIILIYFVRESRFIEATMAKEQSYPFN